MKCFAAILLTVTFVTGAASEASVRTCEPIKVAMCKNIGYNQTGMPNLARHTLQADADVTLQTFTPLVQYGCSPQLDLFLCTVYVPMCTDKVALPIGPCRGLCESVYARCYPVLSGFGFPWPTELDCSLFPAENNHEHMCMEGPGDHAPPVGTISLDASNSGRPGACKRLLKPKSWVWVRGSGRCAQFCDAEVLWEAGERRAAEVWLATWAALSFACTLAAVGAQLACGDRGGAGERALVLVALCRCAAAAGWGVRAAAGRTAAGCAKDSAMPTRMLLAHDGLANPNCAVVFLLLYYFGLAASVWWVVVAGAWRASVLRPPTTPGTARNDRHSSLLQLAAWGVPAALAAAVLVTRDVDADELTGTCFVGNQSTKSLLALVIVPESICLLLGCLFLASGLRAILRRPAPIPAPSALLSGPPQPPTDQSLLRLGAFAALYAVPSTCILATWMYEYAWRDHWLSAPMPSTEPSTHPHPAFWVFLFRIFATQILGVMVAVWIATPRLKALWRMIAGPRKPPLAKCPSGPPPTPLTLHCYATHPHTLSRSQIHKYATYRPPQQHSYRKPRHYHYSAGETIL
ncbi:frizzled-4 [Achroia grisella]|uniref:frizzled-4 n=1 Tax=Achroia grisella TaxID=688607 RepID=UPI0027D34222|nr:frizzled-4 [Achroia grisella]